MNELKKCFKFEIGDDTKKELKDSIKEEIEKSLKFEISDKTKDELKEIIKNELKKEPDSESELGGKSDSENDNNDLSYSEGMAFSHYGYGSDLI